MSQIAIASRLRVYVFSYNRPDFLRNIVRSVRDCIPDAAVVIIDDDSEDRRTRRLLQTFEQEYRVMRPSTDATRQMHKTGGLYANKTLALDDAMAASADYALFMHDDQQIVRVVDDHDLARFDAFFEANRDAIELHTCFFKHDLRDSDRENTWLDASETAYFRDPRQARGHRHFSGSGLFHVSRTKALYGTFPLGEKVNEAHLRDRDILLGFYAWPLMHWLPFPISYRGKKRPISHRIMEWLGGGGFHPIDYMDATQCQAFLARDIEIRPVAEDFLTAPTAPKAEKWSTMGGFYNASARRGFRKALARLIWKQVRREPE